MPNDLELVNDIIQKLTQVGINPILFGGWAEQILGIIPPRKHKDIDLLIISNDFGPVDRFIKSHDDVCEILAKKFPHKRAFIYKDVLIEILLIRARNERLVTSFWDELELFWPTFSPIEVFSLKKNILIAPAEVLKFYTKKFNYINEFRKRMLNAA